MRPCGTKSLPWPHPQASWVLSPPPPEGRRPKPVPRSAFSSSAEAAGDPQAHVTRAGAYLPLHVGRHPRSTTAESCLKVRLDCSQIPILSQRGWAEPSPPHPPPHLIASITLGGLPRTVCAPGKGLRLGSCVSLPAGGCGVGRLRGGREEGGVNIASEIVHPQAG